MGRRGGTESVPLIVALGEASRFAKNKSPADWARVITLRDQFEADILVSIPNTHRNGVRDQRLPNTTNLRFKGIDNDALVTFLDRQDICISSSSACLESAISPSHVIFAMTGCHEHSGESVRISLGEKTTAADISKTTKLIAEFSMLNS